MSNEMRRLDADLTDLGWQTLTIWQCEPDDSAELARIPGESFALETG
jgi:G:T-mismatch repair DNA endonuclease (very short patch repair protein)